MSRHSPDDERRLFPEVPADHDFGRVDVLADIDHDGLSAFESATLDFVIASHVLEHLANPIRAIEEFARVLKPGGVCVLVLPDRRKTFDRNRPGTPLEHVIEEYRTDVRDVSDEHIRDFLRGTGGSATPSIQELSLHRERSVHVHCWTDEEFDVLLDAAREETGCSFALMDAYDCDAQGGTEIEFGYALVFGPFGSIPLREAKRLLGTTGPLAALEPTLKGFNAAETALVEEAARRHALETSRSWRLTKPLRALRSALGPQRGR